MKYILCIYILTICFLCNAQDDKRYNNNLSINCTSPLIQAFNRNKPDSFGFRTATNIALNRSIGNYLLRVSFGGYNNYQVAKSDIYVDRNIFNISKLTGMFSVFKTNAINDKWIFGIGATLSGVYNETENKTDTGFDIVTSYSSSKGGGIGPGILMNYYIYKRISIGTEYSILYNVYRSVDGKTFSSVPSINYEKTSVLNQGVTFQFPLAFYLNYHF